MGQRCALSAAGPSVGWRISGCARPAGCQLRQMRRAEVPGHCMDTAWPARPYHPVPAAADRLAGPVPGSQLLMAVGASALWVWRLPRRRDTGCPVWRSVGQPGRAQPAVVVFCAAPAQAVCRRQPALHTDARLCASGCLLLGSSCWWRWSNPAAEGPAPRWPNCTAIFSLIGQLLYAVLGMALVEQLFRNTPVDSAGASSICVSGWRVVRVRFLSVHGCGCCFIAWTTRSGRPWFCQHDGHPADRDHRGAQSGLEPAGVSVAPHGAAFHHAVQRRPVHAADGPGRFTTSSCTVAVGRSLQIAFLFGAVVVLVALLFSGQFRARTKVFFNKHFFSYRYDYREVAAGHWPAGRKAG